MKQLYKLEYLPIAQKDMAEIVRYISLKLHSPQAAMKLAEEMIDKAETLRAFPYSNAVYIPLRPLKNEYRKILVRNYIMFYTVDEHRKLLTIVRVIYAGHNYERLL